MRFLKPILCIGLFITVISAAADMTESMRFNNADGSFFLWFMAFLVLSAPAFYFFQSKFNRFKLWIGGIWILVLGILGCFPENTFLPWIAVPICGGYDPDYMHMGTILGGTQFWLFGPSIGYMVAMGILISIVGAGLILETIRIRTLKRLIEEAFKDESFHENQTAE